MEWIKFKILYKKERRIYYVKKCIIGGTNKRTFQNLTTEEKDFIYRKVWKEHVISDIKSYLNEIDEVLTDDEIEQASELYVFDGEYDCNLSYWVNIENVIKQVK